MVGFRSSLQIIAGQARKPAGDPLSAIRTAPIGGMVRS
jgi:hypothetical protein